MLKSLALLTLLLAQSLNVCLSNATNSDNSTTILRNITFYIEHSFDSKVDLNNNIVFQPRSKIQFIQKSDGKQSLTFLEKNVIVGKESIEALKALVVNNALYKIRVMTVDQENKMESFAIASLPIVSFNHRYGVIFLTNVN